MMSNHPNRATAALRRMVATTQRDGASINEAEALVQTLLIARPNGDLPKTPRGAANVLLLALAVLQEEYGPQLPVQSSAELAPVLARLRMSLPALRAERDAAEGVA